MNHFITLAVFLLARTFGARAQGPVSVRATNGTAVFILLLCVLCGYNSPAATITLTNLGPAVTGLTASITSNSTAVTINNPGTNTFYAGQVIELFGAFTNADEVCLIQGVTSGTNITVLYPAGVTSTNVNCIIGTNNLAAIQTAVNSLTTGANTIQFTQTGSFLCVNPLVLTTNTVMSSEFMAVAGITLTNGGITFLGTNGFSLMSCGAGMLHPANNMPYGFAPYDVLRSTLFWITDNGGTMGNLGYPLVFSNLVMDGGVLPGTGLTPDYTYFPPSQSNGHGWDPTHDAVIQVGSGASGSPQFCSLIFTGCTAHGWRGEMWKSTIGSGGTNTAITVAGCAFYDGCASALNFTFAQTVTGCAFTNLVKVVEFDQHYATLPSLFSNLWWTNIVSNPFSIVGANTNAASQPILICGGTNWGIANFNQYTMSPAANVTFSNLTFHGPALGIAFTGVGLQPSDGSASSITNIVIESCAFNDTYTPIYMDGYPVIGATIQNCTYAPQTGNAFTVNLGPGYKSGVVFSGNSGGGPFGHWDGVTAGSFPLMQTNGFTPVQITDSVGVTNSYFYYNGGQLSVSALTNSLIYLDSSAGALIPAGAQIVVSNSGSASFPLSSAGQQIISLPAGQAVTEYWQSNQWSTNANNTTQPQLMMSGVTAHGVTAGSTN
jgi:hypothetical protein